MQYKWLSLTTGNSGVSNFNGTQHYIFSDPYGMPQRTLDKVAADLIATWNRQQPNNWYYELIK